MIAQVQQFPAVDALLLIEIGNTRVGVGVWDAEGVQHVQRVAAVDSEAWEQAVSAAWAHVANQSRTAVVVGSVQPRLTRPICDWAEQISDHEACRVRDELPFPMPLLIDNADEVGVDRICAAAAAYEQIQDACAIASFGTAITIDCVDAEGRFLGGAILPGLRMSCEALHDHTAQLPEVEPIAPDDPFGRNTVSAIGGGVTIAAVGALREIVERYATALGRWPQLIVTGGDAGLIQGQADFVDRIVPDLGLMGLALTYRRAAGQA